MDWLLWALMLMAQNACGTWTSRARNSSSIKYHAIASFFNNGVYFANLAVGVNKLTADGSFWNVAGILAFYATFTMIGSITSHWLLMHHVEKKFSFTKQTV